MEVLNYLNEIWKNISGFDGLYQASNFGRVRSMDRIVKHGYGGTQVIKQKYLKFDKTNNGYLRVTLSKDGVTKRYLVHRLVWETFNGEIPEGMQINHKSECKTDNRLENLELVTCKENLNYGNHNKKVSDALINNPKISRKVIQYDMEGNIIQEWPSLSEIQRQTGYLVGNIYKCCILKYKQAYNYKWVYG